MDDTVTKSLLVGLAEEGMQEVLRAFTAKSFQAGETIVKIGEPGDDMFLIVAGKVRVWTGSGADISARTLCVLGPGEHFGEAAMLSRGQRTATVAALTYVETLVLSGDDYRQLLTRHPKLLENISRSLTRRLTQMNDEITGGREHRRGVHSLAIIVADPAGWSLASTMLGQLRRRDQIVKPLVVHDGGVPFELAQVDPDAIEVAPHELAHVVANRSRGKQIAVAIAHGKDSSAAAIKECERVIFAIDANHGLDCQAGKQAIEIPPHRRPIVAFLYDGASDSRTTMRDDRICSVPVPYQRDGSGQPHLAKLDAAAVTRIDRALTGMRMGLALGGGGAKGIAHVGVLEVFARRGIVFDSLAGTSAGAIVAAAVAAGFTSDQVGQFFRDEMIPSRFMASRQMLRRMFLLRSFRGGRFETKLRRYLHHLDFSQLALPLAITTVDMITGKERIRREGDVVNAVLQSINHPVFGSPIIQGDEMLVDGGVLINVPASVLRDEGCDYVVSIDVGGSLSDDFGKAKNGALKRPSYFSTLLRTMDLGRQHCSELHRDESDMIVFPKTGAFKIEDFHAVDELIDIGREAGEKHYAEVEQLLKNAELNTA